MRPDLNKPFQKYNYQATFDMLSIFLVIRILLCSLAQLANIIHQIHIKVAINYKVTVQLDFVINKPVDYPNKAK